MMTEEPAVGVAPVPAASAVAEAPVALPRRVPPALTWLLQHRSWLALATGVALGVLFLLVPLDQENLLRYGYVGVFVTTLVATGSLILPVPYLVTVAAAAMVLDPLLVGLVAGLASSLGEITGYLVGFAGSTVLQRGRWHGTIERWVQHRGFWAVFILALVPNPIFDAAGVAAGALAMPLRDFWLSCLAGKTLRLTAIAWLASLAPGVVGPWLR